MRRRGIGGLATRESREGGWEGPQKDLAEGPRLARSLNTALARLFISMNFRVIMYSLS